MVTQRDPYRALLVSVFVWFLFYVIYFDCVGYLPEEKKRGITPLPPHNRYLSTSVALLCLQSGRRGEVDCSFMQDTNAYKRYISWLPLLRCFYELLSFVIRHAEASQITNAYEDTLITHNHG